MMRPTEATARGPTSIFCLGAPVRSYATAICVNSCVLSCPKLEVRFSPAADADLGITCIVLLVLLLLLLIGTVL
jgi:hypothetical protein